MITLVILSILLHGVYSEAPQYLSAPFRPSQPYPLTDRIELGIPAKQYGPPKPVYGVPTKPDDTIEPTTPPNNFKGIPSKFNNQKVQNRPPNGHQQATIVFPSQQMSAQQFNQLSQQQLPSFNQILFRPQQNQKFTNGNLLQGLLLPNPVRVNTFKANTVNSPVIQVPQSFQQLPFRNFNYEIQKSQEFQVRDAMPTRAPPSNVNLNNQNTINVQTPSLFNINTVTKQKSPRDNQMLQRASVVRKTANIGIANPQAEILNGNQFLNNGALAAKRASSTKRGGKVKATPSRQYLSPESTTAEPVVPPVPRTQRRRPSTTEAPETLNNPVGKGPNVAISNSFAGRLFLLQPDGRLEQVILKRANAGELEDRNNISPAEILQPFFSRVSSSLPK